MMYRSLDEVKIFNNENFDDLLKSFDMHKPFMSLFDVIKGQICQLNLPVVGCSTCM